MDQWWTYELSDLILFSSHTYYRLIELYNLAIWPLQSIAILLSFTLLYLSIKRPNHHGKIISVILVLCWLWVAWVFHWQRFSTIHWVASYFAIAYVIQSALLLWFGVIKNQFQIHPTDSAQRIVGLVLLCFALLIQPFIMLLAGHSWKQAELFGITPDSTIIVTIALLLLTDLRSTGWLLVIPLLWCFVSGATLYVLQSLSIIGLVLAGLSVIAVFAMKKYRDTSLTQ